MKKLCYTFFIVASLVFTGCTDTDTLSTQSNSNNNISSDTTYEQPKEEYNVSGYWKVNSEEIDTGYYIVEFKNNNVMIEYLPSNNIFETNYEIKHSSINSLSILTANGTLINLQKIDDLNMSISYDTVTQHATKISKVDFTTLLNELSASKDDTIIYNSNYYQEYDENYTLEENNLTIEEHYTNVEQNNVSIEENYTNIENTDIDDNDVTIEESTTDIYQKDINIEEDTTNIEQQDIDIEENSIN